ncbi:transcription factor TFIIIB component B'' homolog isoform X13 [Brienomyrus brachyistius]|uniref:transcription factor TFIIIB component B'' homolog isoform X12 n=1 Tax=Brienomyrus brachyistius TaxID=42636 RepID=UPI0020B447F8|nr:transcription factor TFIIIB component B'' homolog isoform X12 [Brienomyrus brachyistius]XP_048861188.1 transcription factor TFIIIB component B'' homolog isoform X13 [Brienomyrus brachyistius]
MMRRARISVRPNVRPVGRGPSSSQDGQSILASTVNSLAAGETSQTIEMVSNVTDNEPSPEDSAIKFPEASEFTSTHDTLSEKALCNLGENGQTCVTFDDCIPADTSLKRRESVSDVCNIAQPRVIPKPLSAKALESSVSKSVTMASCSVAPVSVPEDQTVTEDEGLQSRGQQKLPVRGKRPRKAKNLGLSFAGVCVPSPEDLAVSMRKESESQPSTSAVVHETSSMSSYQERIIKSRMLKQLMKDELRKGRTKHKPHLEYINPLDHSKMTMRDLIYYLPDGNPMKSCMKDEQTGKENLRLLSNERKEIPQKEAEEEKDDCDEDLSQNDDELVVPKVKVAEDGSLILDEDSLTVKVSKTTGPAIVEENDPLFECGSTATYSSFRKIRHVKPWSIKETDMFFLAISMVGTDFSIIGRLFPHRPRKEIKNKFRKEERINAWRIDKAFREKRPYDEQFFSMLLGRILTTEKKKRNVNMRDSKAKKVNNQESKPKKKKMKTKIEVSVMENAQQDESHITIEEEESDCRVTEGNMEMTEKNEDSINVLKVGNKTLPNKKPGKRRNTEEVLDTSSAKPVDGKKRKMKTSVEIINCDKVGDAQTSSEEPESTMEHTASGDRSNGATGMLSPSSRRCCQNPTANIGKRVRKRIPGSPENREICSAEDESRVNSICVSTVENEAAILNREEVKKAGQIITPGEDFLEEPENMDCQLNRFEGHEDMFSSGSSVKHRPREACTLTSIPAKKSCQEKEYSASSSPDGVKVDTVNDESAIKYIQNVPTENGEKESSEQNGIQDEMARSGCLSHEDLFDSSSTIQHRPREACTLTSITAEKSCQEKEYSASSSPDGVKMDTVHNESAIKYIQNVLPENTEKDSSGQNWTLDEMSSRAYHPLRSPSIREKIPEAVMEKDMQPVIAISSTVKAEVVTHLPPKGDSCGVITTVEMVTEAVTTDVTEQEPTFILTLVPVSEVPPPPESTEQQSEMLLPASQRYSTQYSTLERDFVSDQVLNTSSSSVTQKDTKDPEDYFAKHSSKRNVPEATKKEEATLNEEPEQLDILPSSPKTVQPISVKSSTEEAVTDSAKVEMSQDTVSLSDLSVKNKNKETAEDQSSPTFKSEEEILKSNPLITPLFLKALKFQNNNDDTETERKMPLDLPISSHSSASDINATYSPSSPTKVYSSISEPAQCEFLCANVKEIDEEPTNVSEYFLSDIFTEVKESESD